MGQFLNNPSTFVRASGLNPAVNPQDYVRKQEFDAGISGRAATAHTHNAADITDLDETFLALLERDLHVSDTIEWLSDGSGVQGIVRRKIDGGILADSDGLYIDTGSGTGQIATADYVRSLLHDPVTLAASQTIDGSLAGQQLSLEMRILPDGGLYADPNGSGIACDFGSGTNQVSRGDHTHDQLHDPLTKQDTNSIAVTLTGQLFQAEVRRKTSFSAGQGAILEDTGGIYVELGSGLNQAAPGNHPHPDATALASGFLSPENFLKLQNAANLVQYDQSLLFSRHDVLVGSGTEYVGGRFRFGQSMECVHLDLTAAGGTASGTLGLEIDGTVVESIDIPAASDHAEVANYKSLTGVFFAADKYVRIKATGGLDADAYENNPARLNVTVGIRPALVAAPTVRINSGGSAADPFAADGYYSGGAVSTTTTACDVSAVSSPAPQAVYKSVRRSATVDPVVYTVTGLARGINYTVRLHFNQFLFSGIEDEVFHIRVIGATTQSTLWMDIIDEAGAQNKAFIQEYTAAPDSSGQIQIRLEPQAGNGGAYGCSICGLEFIPL